MNPQRFAASLVVVAALAAGVAACGDNSPATTTTATTTPVDRPRVDVAVGVHRAGVEARRNHGPGSVPDSSLPTVESASAVLVGLTEAEAHDAAAEHGWTVRVARLDGEDQPLTMGFREDRVNVEITDGTVASVVSIG